MARFKLGHHVSVSTCHMLLGLMAATMCCAAPGVASYEAVALVDETVRGPPDGTSFSPSKVGLTQRLLHSMWRVTLYSERGQYGCFSPLPNGYYRCLSDRLGHGLRGQASLQSLTGRVPLLPNKQPGAKSRLSGTDTFSTLFQGVSCDCQD